MDQQKSKTFGILLLVSTIILFITVSVLLLCMRNKQQNTHPPRENFDNNRPVPKICHCIISHMGNKKVHDEFKHRKDTWIVVGDENQKQPYRIEDGMLILRVNDKYFGLPEKVIMMQEAFLNMPELKKYTHLYKIDDDCDIYDPIPQSFLNFVRNQDYAGSNVKNLLRQTDNHRLQASAENQRYHFKYSYQDPANYWATHPYEGNYVNYTSGGNYILSRQFIQKINGIWNSKNIDLLRTTEVFEDLMIGKVAFLLGVPPVLIPKDIIYVVDEVYRARYKTGRKPKNNSN